MDITFTDAAINKLRDIIAEDGGPNHALRVFVSGGGCSGFQYGFTLDKDQAEDDMVFERDGVKIFVDVMSYQYLSGAQVDYTEDAMGAQFAIKNPNATTTCGCGSSFSV